MLKLRIELMSSILSCSDSDSVKTIFYSVLKNKIKCNTKLKRIRRFIPVLESDVRFELHKDLSKKERTNLKEALNLIKEDFDINQITYE